MGSLADLTLVFSGDFFVLNIFIISFHHQLNFIQFSNRILKHKKVSMTIALCSALVIAINCCHNHS